MTHHIYADDSEFLAVLSYIEDADCNEIDAIIDAVIHRYCRHHPEWDILFLSLPKEECARRKQLERMLEMLKNGETI